MKKTDLCLCSEGAEVILATSSDEKYPPENIIDGNPGTFWTTTGMFPQEFIICFHKHVRIEKLVIQTSFVRTLKIEKSTSKEPVGFEPWIQRDLVHTEGQFQNEEILAGEYSSTSSASDESDADNESAPTSSDSESESDSAKRPPDCSGHAPNCPVQAEKKQPPSYCSLRMDSLSRFRKTCASHRSASPYYREYLTDWSKKAYWGPQDFHVVAKTCLSRSQYMQWRMWFSDEAKAKRISPARQSLASYP